MPRKTVTFVAFALLMGGIALFLSFAPQPSFRKAAVAEASGVVMRGYDVEGRLTWEARATQGEILDSAGTLLDVALDLYNGADRALTVAAERLMKDGQTGTLEGGVHAVRGDGLGLTTDRLTWSETEQTLHSGSTQVFYASSQLDAERLEYDLRQGRARLDGVTASLAQGEDLHVVSNRAEITGSTVILEGSVELTTSSALFSCQRLETDLDGEGGVSLSGGVAASGEGFRATAETVDVTADGWFARGGVVLDVDALFFGSDHDS